MQETPLIRSARQDDAERLTEIARSAYLSYVPRIGKEPAPMLADFARHISDGEVWVLDDPPIGYIVMRVRDDTLFVENVAVDPVRHGFGYGGRLLEFAEEHGTGLGLTQITLYTNIHMTENRSFYPSIGYREVARRMEDGVERVYFSKPLPVHGIAPV